jgi:hypothetical protein
MIEAGNGQAVVVDPLSKAAFAAASAGHGIVGCESQLRSSHRKQRA